MESATKKMALSLRTGGSSEFVAQDVVKSACAWLKG
jgi:hypothetical protein